MTAISVVIGKRSPVEVIGDTGALDKILMKIRMHDELLAACNALLHSCTQSVWSHIDNMPSGTRCECKSCSQEFALSVIKKASANAGD